ncbi:MAG: hypothetical protein ACO3UU_09050 [Minisyncoccia bacterium]
MNDKKAYEVRYGRSEVEKNYRRPGFNNPRKYTDDLGIMGKDYEPCRLDKKEEIEDEYN